MFNHFNKYGLQGKWTYFICRGLYITTESMLLEIQSLKNDIRDCKAGFALDL